METVKLTQVFTTNKDKNGNALTSKDGKPYTRMSIKTEQHGDKWISGFQNATNKSWKKGDEVQVTIKENGEYLNFETPKGGMSNEKLDKIYNKLLQVDLQLNLIAEHLKLKANVNDPRNQMEYPDEINPSDIPF